MSLSRVSLLACCTPRRWIWILWTTTLQQVVMRVWHGCFFSNHYFFDVLWVLKDKKYLMEAGACTRLRKEWGKSRGQLQVRTLGLVSRCVAESGGGEWACVHLEGQTCLLKIIWDLMLHKTEAAVQTLFLWFWVAFCGCWGFFLSSISLT